MDTEEKADLLLQIYHIEYEIKFAKSEISKFQYLVDLNTIKLNSLELKLKKLAAL